MHPSCVFCFCVSLFCFCCFLLRVGTRSIQGKVNNSNHSILYQKIINSQQEGYLMGYLAFFIKLIYICTSGYFFLLLKSETLIFTHQNKFCKAYQIRSHHISTWTHNNDILILRVFNVKIQSPLRKRCNSKGSKINKIWRCVAHFFLSQTC